MTVINLFHIQGHNKLNSIPTIKLHILENLEPYSVYVANVKHYTYFNSDTFGCQRSIDSGSELK